jgi:hypothetical protein
VLLKNDTPFILSVTPGDGAILQGVNSETPSITVTFSEPVNATQAGDRTNYLLFSSSGQTITIDSATPSGINQTNNSTTGVTIAYNEGNPLPASTYTLFVRGDHIEDVDDHRFMAQPGQFVAANTGTNSVSVVNVSDQGVVGALSNYPDPVGSKAMPQAVAFGNFDGVVDAHGNPIPDLVVANAGSNTISIFQGKVGGGYGVSPTVVLALPANANPSGIVVADFNKDGLPDFAVSDAGTNQVTVFLNKRPANIMGELSFATGASYAAGQDPVGIVAADFNQDGNLDLAVADHNPDPMNPQMYEVSVLLGDGTGKFGTANAFGVGNTMTGIISPTSIATGLLNNDVYPDLVVGGGVQGGNSAGLGILFNTTPIAHTLSFSNLNGLTTSPTSSVVVGVIDATGHQDIAATTQGSSSQVLLFKNDGLGNFTQAPSINLNAPATGITLQDINGDKLNDILVANNTSTAPGSVQVLLNTSSGSTVKFQNPVSYAIPGVPVSLALGDTNQDGKLDLVTANSSANDVSLFVGNGDGTFQQSTDFALGSGAAPTAVAVGDLNGDGLPDLVTVDKGTNQIAVQLATGTGTYGAPQFYSVGSTPVAVAMGDLLANGRKDIVVADQGDNTITVLINDGTGKNFTKSTINVGTTPTGIALGDFNSDGFPDIAVSHNGSSTDPTKRGVTLLLNNQNGTFRSGGEIAQGTFASAVAAAQFTTSGHVDLAVANDQAAGAVQIYSGDGRGGFTLTSTVNTIDSPTSLAVGDVNADGFQDIVVGGGSSTGTSTGNLDVLVNQSGTGFVESVPGGMTVHDVFTVLGNVAITDIQQNGIPDLVVTIASESTKDTQGNFHSVTPANNIFVLQGDGQGHFSNPQPFLAGGLGAAPSAVAVISDPLLHAETFTILGNLVNANLIRNGNFALGQLNNPQGYLAGWNVFKESGSRGAWAGQNTALPTFLGSVSPLSLTSIPPPPGENTAAVLDQSDINYFDAGGIDDYAANAIFPPIIDELGVLPPGLGGTLAFGTGSPNDYQGTNILYQDFTIPATTSSLVLSFSLLVQAGNPFTNSNQFSALTYTSNQPNQQVRIDLMDPTANLEDVGSGVLKNIYQTDPSTPTGSDYAKMTVDLTPFLNTLAGKTIRLRIAGVTNQGKLIVGLSNVKMLAAFNAQALPEIVNLRLRNPGFGTSPSSAGTTSDQAIIGQVLSQDIGSPNDISFVAFDTTGTGKFQAGTFRINSLQWDATGNFSVDFRKLIPGGLLPGPHTINVRAVDVAGDKFDTAITFSVQGPSNLGWDAQGPGPILTAGTGVQYTTVSGDVTSIAADPRDPTGNTIYLGAANGGVWKSTDGGKNWTPLTDFVFDAAGNAVPENIGGLAVGASANDHLVNASDVIYAATGVATLSAYGGVGHPGHGVLKSTDGGLTWSVVGESVFTGALVSKVVVDPTNANRVYVAVASGGQFGAGVYGSADGGGTWSNLTLPTTMFLADGTSLSFNTVASITSVTDITINPFNTEDLLIGMGNMGLPAGDARTAGVWQTGNFGGTWSLVVGGHNVNLPNDTIPDGFNTSIGKVNIAIGTGTASDPATWYIMMASPPPAAGPHPPGGGDFLGLYKTKNFGLDWTKVQLREEIPKPSGTTFIERNVDIDPFGAEANNVGALVVDPTNPNIVYLGGSQRYTSNFSGDGTIFIAGDHNELVHPFLMIDTSQLVDTTATIPAGTRPAPLNTGDSWAEETEAWATHMGFPENDDLRVYPGTTTQSRTSIAGVGAYWVDLSENVSGNDGWLGSAAEFKLLPAGINFLTFNGAGRLLVGTVAGIYEGFSGGFSPGFQPDDSFLFQTSATAPPEFDFQNHLFFDVGMPAFVDINGNLQISNLTTVAVNPTNPNAFFTSQADTGTSQSTGSLTWLPLLSLSLPIAPFGGENIPSAAAVRISPSDPTIPNSQPKVYVAWQFAGRDTGLQVDVSPNGGALGTFEVMDSGLRTLSDNSDQFPVLVANPTNPAGELIFGTQTVYETDTAGGSWDSVSSSAGIQTGAVVTAAAIAPSGQDVFYVGTDAGTVYVTQNNGADGFPLESSGLPGARINGLTVDPNNPNLAYAMLGGIGIDHVFMTNNGGQTWTDIGAGLPDVPAFSMAIDPTSVPGALQGRLYLGTQVGVYISADRGKTWSQLGLGLPHAPVVDMEFDPKSKEIAAAVQGRGVFTIFTDLQGPRVTSSSPSTPGAPPATTFITTFNKPVNPTSLVVDAETRARNTQVVNPLDHTLEYFNRLVGGYFTRFLKRTGSAAEIATYAVPLQSGATTDEQVIAQIVGLPEYFANRANNNNTTWFVTAYTDLIGQGPSQAQINLALNQLQSQGQPRTTVAFNDILSTTTYQQVLVTNLLNQYLQRNPTTGELSDALALIAKGATDEQLITKIVSSPEFYQVNGSRFSLVSGLTPTAVALADLSGALDFNRKAIPDLIVGLGGSSNNVDSLVIYQGLPGGGFSTAPIALTFPTSALPINPSAIVVGDFNGDGLPDIAVADQANNQIVVFINNRTSAGTISFANGVSYQAGNAPVGLVAANLDPQNLTKNIDLVAVDSMPDNSGNFNLVILQGKGDGTFNPTPTLVNTGLDEPTGVAAGDLNGDGLLDLAVSSQSGLTLFFNQTATVGQYVFPSALQQLLTSLDTRSVAIGRVDTSASNSVVTTTPDNGGQVLIFQNPGGSSPAFGSPTAFNAGPSPVAVRLQDLLGVGLNDILVANNDPQGTVTILRNRTAKASLGLDTLAFDAPVSYQVGSNPVSLAIGDVNRDGVADVVTNDIANDTAWISYGNNDASIQTPTDQSFIDQAFVDLVGRQPTSSEMNTDFTNLGNAEQVYLNGPRGRTVPLDITALDPNSGSNYPFDTQYQFTFAPQVANGTYTLKVGTNTLGINVQDFIGLAQDQNQNQINGELPQDQYITQTAIATTDDSSFVSTVFQDLLARAPSNAEFIPDYATVETQRSSQVSAMASKLVTSTRGQVMLVDGVYSSLLNRFATPAEFANWVGFLRQGGQFPQIVANVASTDEFFADAGMTVQGFINALYQDLLERAPTASELATGQALLGINPNQAARLTYTKSIVAGSEYLGLEVQNAYIKFLGRYATSSEQSTWIGILNTPSAGAGTPSRFEQLEISLLTSPEFFFRQQDINNGLETNNAWLTTTYALIRQEPPTQLLLADYNSVLNGYATQRTNLVSAIDHGAEYYTDLVNGYFTKFSLGKPTAAQLATYVGELQSGTAPETVIAQLLSSSQFFITVANSSNAQWASLVYQLLLNTAPPSGLVAQLNAGTITLLQAALNATFGNAYITQVVNGFYNTYLGRPATTQELKNWVPNLQSGVNVDQDVITNLISSTEFFNRLTHFQSPSPGNLPATLPFADTFGSGTELSAKWSNPLGNATLVNGFAIGESDFNLAALNGVNQSNVKVQADVTLVAGQQVGLVARYGGPGYANFYLGQLRATGSGVQAAIFSNVGGTFSTLVVGSTVSASAGTLEFEVVGQSLKLIFNGKLVADAFDSALATGSVGLRMSGVAVASNFQASAIPNATLPFSDNFNPPGDASQLDSNWVDQIGNISVNASNQAVGNSDTNLSTLVGVSQGDVKAVAQVSVAVGSGQTVGLVARYGGPLYNNFYLAQIRDTGAGLQAAIFKNVGGVFTTIAVGSTVASLGNATLEFEAVGSSLKLIYGGTLVAFGFDSSLTTGSVGMRLSMGAAVSSFTAAQAQVTEVTVPPTFSDNFTTTSDGSQLDSAWRDQLGNITVNSSHQAVGTSDTNLSTLNVLKNGDIQSDVTVTAQVNVAVGSGQTVGLVARYGGPLYSNFYLAQIRDTGAGLQAAIFKNVGGVFTTIAVGSTFASLGSTTLEFEAVGSSLKLIYGGTLVAFGFDSSLTSGSVGVRLSNGAAVSSISAAAATVTNVTSLPFNDNFNTTSDGSQLDSAWRDQLGNITVNGSHQAVGTTDTNLSTVNGLSIGDVTVQGTIDVTGASGMYAGLVARYSGPGYNNFYLAQVRNSGSGFVAAIFANVGGTFTTVAVATSASGKGVLKFKLTGPVLEVDLDSTVLITVVDSTITAAGSVGMRLGANATLASFSAM